MILTLTLNTKLSTSDKTKNLCDGQVSIIFTTVHGALRQRKLMIVQVYSDALSNVTLSILQAIYCPRYKVHVVFNTLCPVHSWRVHSWVLQSALDKAAKQIQTLLVSTAHSVMILIPIEIVRPSLTSGGVCSRLSVNCFLLAVTTIMVYCHSKHNR